LLRNGRPLTVNLPGKFSAPNGRTGQSEAGDGCHATTYAKLGAMYDAANYWLVTGTAAPVIILANVVLFGDTLKLLLDFRSASNESPAISNQKKLAATGSKYEWITLGFSYANFVAQSVALGVALGFFWKGPPGFPPVLIQIFFAFGLITLFIASICSGLARHTAARIKSAPPEQPA
jgi:hypothetical protein